MKKTRDKRKLISNSQRVLQERWDEKEMEIKRTELLENLHTNKSLPVSIPSGSKEDQKDLGLALGADLRCIDLSGEKLDGVDLSNARMQGANLARCSLKKAKLVNSDLRNVTLRRANLAGANLSGANLDGALLEKTNLKKTNLTNTIFTQSTIVDDDVDLQKGVIRFKASSWCGNLRKLTTKRG